MIRIRDFLMTVLALGLNAGLVRAESPETPEITAATLPSLNFPAPNPAASDLPGVEAAVTKMLPRAVRTTVGLRLGEGQGTGVIISPDGLILTAGHVSKEANLKVEIIYHDGSRTTATTLGANHSTDTGLLKLDNADNVEYSPLNTAPLALGQWTVAVGQPGGYQAARSPVVRVGRVLRISESVVVTDNSLIGGDSGGPLFDLAGNVIAIHSRIGQSVASNMHVPIATFQTDFPRLLAGDVWGERPSLSLAPSAYLGVTAKDAEDSVVIDSVTPNSPAARAGIQPGDAVVSINDRRMRNTRFMLATLTQHRPGDKIEIVLRRPGESATRKLTVTLARQATTQPSSRPSTRPTARPTTRPTTPPKP